jgi:hypothetical protein
VRRRPGNGEASAEGGEGDGGGKVGEESAEGSWLWRRARAAARVGVGGGGELIPLLSTSVSYRIVNLFIKNIKCVNYRPKIHVIYGPISLFFLSCP